MKLYSFAALIIVGLTGLFSILFSLTGTTIPLTDQQITDDILAGEGTFEYNYVAPSEANYAQKLDNLDINLHPGTEYKPESKSSPRSLRHCKSLIYRTLKSLPQEPVNKLQNLTLYFSDDGRRGLGGGSTIILRCQNVTDEVLVSVLVHEMGHIMDTGVMNGTWHGGRSKFRDGSKPVYKNDISVDFYEISWVNESKMKSNSSKLDFVSGYAKSDPFEDFAESYTYYILHGNEFRSLAKHNERLRAKYDYLKTRIFDEIEYETGTERGLNILRRRFDVTVLPYDIDQFFVV